MNLVILSSLFYSFQRSNWLLERERNLPGVNQYKSGTARILQNPQTFIGYLLSSPHKWSVVLSQQTPHIHIKHNLFQRLITIGHIYMRKFSQTWSPSWWIFFLWATVLILISDLEIRWKVKHSAGWRPIEFPKDNQTHYVPSGPTQSNKAFFLHPHFKNLFWKPSCDDQFTC